LRGRIDVAVAGVLSVVALALHAEFFVSAGPLWRDEVAILHVATSSPALLWERLNFESFPLVWPLLLRTWCAVFGQGISSLRTLGLVIGIASVAALWIASRALQLRAPLIALACVALNGAVIRFGDMLRAYGLSCIVGLLALTAVWKAARFGTRRNWLIATLACVVAVHTTFFNTIVVLAICVAAMIASREIVKPLLAGGVSAASLLIYLPVIRARAAWSAINTVRVTPRDAARGFLVALAKNGALSAWMTVAVIAAAMVCAAMRHTKSGERTFALATLLIVLLGEAIFLVALRNPPVPWYFVLPLAIAGICADVLLAGVPLRLILAVVVAAAGLAPAVAYVSLRSTNADGIARALQTLARPGDAIVVYPWYCGVTLAPDLQQPWTTLPPIADHSVHRYDLLQQLAARNDAAQPAVNATTAALRGGHRVWLAGFPLGSENSGPYDRIWCAALSDALRANARRAMMVVAPDPKTIANERMQLVVFER
jgi:hypothetical protein